MATTGAPGNLPLIDDNSEMEDFDAFFNGIATALNSALSTLYERVSTESQTGLAELATQAEVNTGTDTTRIVTPSKLRNSVNLPFATAAGSVGAINIAAGVETATAITFPAGRFSVAPIVTTQHSPFRDVSSWATNITKDGFTLYRGNMNVGARNSVTAQWIAVQMTSGAAAG